MLPFVLSASRRQGCQLGGLIAAGGGEISGRCSASRTEKRMFKEVSGLESTVLTGILHSGFSRRLVESFLRWSDRNDLR